MAKTPQHHIETSSPLLSVSSPTIPSIYQMFSSTQCLMKIFGLHVSEAFICAEFCRANSSGQRPKARWAS